MENVGVIEKDEIQVMSAGTGVSHSEYNKSKEKPVSLLQIWIFPKEQNVTPRYDQKNLKELQKMNSLYPIVTPNKSGTECGFIKMPGCTWVILTNQPPLNIK